jgi:hypothetical protein
MPAYTLYWTNRSQSDQDWQINNGDTFELQPNFTRRVQIVINNTYTFQIAVTTDGGFAACTLTWTQATQTWSLNSMTPAEWQLAAGGANVTVRCLLEDAGDAPEYVAAEPEPDTGT